MEKERIEEIKNWLAKVTLGKKSCVIDLTRATREIPRLLTALEAAQKEAAGLREALQTIRDKYSSLTEEDYRQMQRGIYGPKIDIGWAIGICTQALARTEKEE